MAIYHVVEALVGGDRLSISWQVIKIIGGFDPEQSVPKWQYFSSW
jgi:hypothetical protein